MSIEAKMVKALALMDEAIRATNPIAVFGMFSGGHDSLTATGIAARHPKFTAAAHMNTGIGIEKTREFVRRVSKERGWDLREYKALDCGQDYAVLAKEWGFPGPAQHKKMYARLKERPLRALIRDTKKGRSRLGRVALVTGIRSSESRIRMGYKEHWRREGSYVWINPIHDWSKSDCHEFMEYAGLPRNEVVDLMHMSGECLCGAFAHEGERQEIKTWFPEVDAHLSKIEKSVPKKNVRGEKLHPNLRKWGWCALVGKGSKPPDRSGAPGPLCYGCDGKIPK